MKGGYGILRERVAPGVDVHPEWITLRGNIFGTNNGTVVPGVSTRNLGNHDQILDPSDDQPNF